MKILYVCKPGVSGQDDEGAIEHALRVLGHDVDRRDERSPFASVPDGVDLILIHKLPTDTAWYGWLVANRDRRSAPVACWYFDRVRDDDPDMRVRSEERMLWMSCVSPFVTYLFCTDGDWADEQNLLWAKGLRKFVDHLPQGADERWWQFPPVSLGRKPARVLFTGNANGTRRTGFVRWCKQTWGPGFRHHARGLYGYAFVAECRQAKVVVAPPTPVTPRYCSNRAYTVMASGGLLIHPECQALADTYPEDGPEWYSNLTELANRVEYWLARPREARELAEQLKEQTWTRSLYRHRLEKLLATVRHGS